MVAFKFVYWCSLLPVVANAFTASPIIARQTQSNVVLAMNSLFQSGEDGIPEEHQQQQRQVYQNNNQKYLQGNELFQLRTQILKLRSSLHKARSQADAKRVHRLSRAILDAQKLDAEFVYHSSLERLKYAATTDEHEYYHTQAASARAALPQFQLEGLWVGKYGDSFQIINVTYTNDILVAHKVTASPHVPRGEVSFTVDLSESLEPLLLEPAAAETWGTPCLERYAGRGQVASSGFLDSALVEGQLVLVSPSYFSFAWMPTGHQVFFGRPSAELVLKLLRGGDDNDLCDRDYLERCYAETEYLQDDLEVADDKFAFEQAYYYNQAGCFE